MASVPRPGGAASDFPVADDAARVRGRLRASEAQEFVGQVVEFQLARQRAELVMPEVVEPLSTREREVLALLAVGRTDGEYRGHAVHQQEDRVRPRREHQGKARRVEPE